MTGIDVEDNAIVNNVVEVLYEVVAPKTERSSTLNGLTMPLHCTVRPCVAVFGRVWLCVLVCGSALPCVAVCGCMWGNMAVQGCVTSLC